MSLGARSKEGMAMRRLPFGFQQLLITLVGFLMVPGMFGEQIGLLLPLMFTLVLVSCLYLVAENRSQLLIVCILAVPPLLTNFQLGLFDDQLRNTLNLVAYLIFLFYVARHILLFLLQAQQISSDVIYGALCLYLILGFFWGLAYALLGVFSPEAFDADAVSTFADYLYFSFVTITTLGYGDISPVSEFARSLAVVEAITGQIYLAVVIARLVGMQASSG